MISWADGWVQMGLWPCSQLSHLISKPFQSSQNLKIWLNLHLWNMHSSRCVYGQRRMVTGHNITVIILARLLNFQELFSWEAGRQKLQGFYFVLLKSLLSLHRGQSLNKTLLYRLLLCTKMCPYPAAVAGKLELSSENILSDEEDVKCGKTSLQVGSRLLTYKRVPKWRWFRHTHHCHHHHNHHIQQQQWSSQWLSSVILVLQPE